jgi:hypothetical protein
VSFACLGQWFQGACLAGTSSLPESRCLQCRKALETILPRSVAVTTFVCAQFASSSLITAHPLMPNASKPCHFHVTLARVTLTRSHCIGRDKGVGLQEDGGCAGKGMRISCRRACVHGTGAGVVLCTQEAQTSLGWAAANHGKCRKSAQCSRRSSSPGKRGQSGLK